MIHEATTPAAALRWAEFSGDFNPIHFDPAQAAKVGSDRLIVHGMLALLHVKHATLQALRELVPATGWTRFKALFRSPIPQESSLQLSIKPKGSGLRFSLEGESPEYCRGLHEATSAPQRPQTLAHEQVLDVDWVQEQLNKFRNSFGALAQPWIFLDALVFGSFLQQRFAQLAEMSVDMVAVQISHSVTCDADRLFQLFEHAQALPRLSYSVRAQDSSVQPASESGAAQLDVFAGEELVMQIEIGLLARSVAQT